MLQDQDVEKLHCMQFPAKFKPIYSYPSHINTTHEECKMSNIDNNIACKLHPQYVAFVHSL